MIIPILSTIIFSSKMTIQFYITDPTNASQTQEKPTLYGYLLFRLYNIYCTAVVRQPNAVSIPFVFCENTKPRTY